MTIQPFPLIEVSRPPHERGRQYGRQEAAGAEVPFEGVALLTFTRYSLRSARIQSAAE